MLVRTAGVNRHLNLETRRRLRYGIARERYIYIYILDECNAFLASGSNPTAYIADV